MILKELHRANSDVITATENDRICDVAELMRREKVGSVVIVDGRVVVGIITDRDIALGVTLGAATPDSYVSAVMTRDVATVEETESLFNVTRCFRTACVKRMPVVNRNGELVGIISIDDVMAMLSREMYDTCSSLEPKLGHMV